MARVYYNLLNPSRFERTVGYKDLDPSNWPMECQPADHPILRSLLHEGFAADNVELPPLSGENDNLSAFAPPLTSTTLCSVLDADSSQASAILQVKAGRSFVIQGPPGTGKSQTITNLIAESIAEGKTVLFVAEKMAALEVVKRRLDHVGLNSAYLEFHSHKTNKQAFLQELQRTLQLSQPRHQEREQLIRELKSAHDRLERYYKALLAPVGQSAGFPYWLYGQWSQIQQRLQDIVVPPVAHAWVEILGRWSDSDYQERRSKVQELQLHLHQMGEPRQHPFWGSRRKRLLLPLDQQELTRKLQLALEYLDNLQQAAERLAVICDARVPDDPKTLGLWMATAQHALQAPDLAAVAIEHPEWRNGKDVLRKIIALGRQVQESYEHFEPLLRPEAWQADVEVVHQVLLKHGSKSWRFLVPTYWRVRRTLRAFYRVPPPRRHEHILQTVNVIRLFQYWESQCQRDGRVLASLFGSYWQGLRSNWDHIEAITEYLALTHEEIAVGELPSQILNLLARPQVYEDLRQALDACQHWLAAFQYAFMGVTEALAYDTEASSEGGEGQTYSFSAQRGLLQRWEANVSRLHEIIRWNNLVEEMNCLGLSPILDMVLDEGVVSPHLVDIIDWYRCQSLIETAMIERPELIQFDGAYYSDLTHKFVDMDKRLLELNRAYLAKKHWEGLPRQVADHGMRILAREFEKKRRHLPIRQLIAEAGQTIQKIKPVFLMSPLSVATYLPPGSIDFDLVIFDEASQVLPVDAFGAILRGRQTVVVGDSKQLPPTTT